MPSLDLEIVSRQPHTNGLKLKVFPLRRFKHNRYCVVIGQIPHSTECICITGTGNELSLILDTHSTYHLFHVISKYIVGILFIVD